MVDVVPIGGTGAGGTVHTVALPIRAFGSGAARFFAVVAETPTASQRGGRRRFGHIATILENLAEDGDLPREPAAWFSAYIHHLRDRLHDPDGHQGAAPLSMNIGVGIAYPRGDRIAVTLTRSGAIGAFLISRHARERAVATGILEPEAAAVRVPHFEHAVDGAIHGDDLFIIGTPELVGRTARTAVTQACARLAPAEAPAIIARAVLHEHPSAQGLIVSGSASSSRPRSQRSMDAFLETATSAEHFLTPRLGPVLRQYAAQLRSTTSFFIRRRPRRTPGNRFLPFVEHATQLTVRTIVLGIRSVGALAIDGLRIISIAAIRTLRAARRLHGAAASDKLQATSPTTERGDERAVAPSLKLRASRFALRALRTRQLLTGGTALVTRSRSWYSGLPHTSQRLFVLTTIFALLFLISTGALMMRRSTELNVSTYNTTLAIIEELRSVAEARLLFSDRAAARDALREAEEKLAILPRTSRARRERAAVLEGEIRASLDRARLLTRLHEPLRVARGLRPGASDPEGGDGGIPFTDIGGFSVVGTRLATVAADGSAVAVIDPRNGTVTPYSFASPQLPSRPLRALALDDRSILLIDANAHAARIDIRAGTATAMTIEQPPPDIRDAALFQGRLYLLHTNGQITRHVRTTGGFSRGTVWLRSGDAPSDVRRLIVAGPVFLSSGDGGLAVYFAGRRRDADLRKDIDPPLTTASLLTAPPDGDLLYLGDPADGRVVAIRTNGELIGQIQSDAFRGMTDLSIDSTGAALYVLHGNAISVVIPPKRKE